MPRQQQVQKTSKVPQNRREDDEQGQDGPDTHEDARQARRRAHRTSERAGRFLKETENGS